MSAPSPSFVLPSAGLFALAVAACAVAACGAPVQELPPEVRVSEETFEVAPAASKTRAYRNVHYLGREILPIDPLPSGEPREWHMRVHREPSAGGKEGRVTLVQRVSPSGHVVESIEVEHREARVLRKKNARGALLFTEELASPPEGTTPLAIIGGKAVATDRVVTRTHRSGVVEMDGCVAQRIGFDEAGRMRFALCVDGEGRTILDDDGCHLSRFSYDERGRVSELACFLPDGTPAESTKGHVQRSYYDERGRRTARTWHALAGGPATDPDGCEGVATEYDRASNATLVTCTDANGRPVAAHDRIAARRYTNDANGCRVRMEFLDASLQPTSSLGVATHVYRRDEACEEVGVDTLDLGGELSRVQGQAASRRFVRNDEGLIVEERCVGVDSAPISCQFGHSTPMGSLVRREYDDRGRVVSIRGFDEDDQPSRRSTDYPHEERTEYGPDGRPSVRAFFDERGVPSPLFGGVARWTLSYDALGGLTSKKSYDEAGRPLQTGRDCFDFRFLYDALHRDAGYECRDPLGALVAPDARCFGQVCWPVDAARVTIVRAGGRVKNVFFAPNGSELSQIECGNVPCYR